MSVCCLVAGWSVIIYKELNFKAPSVTIDQIGVMFLFALVSNRSNVPFRTFFK